MSREKSVCFPVWQQSATKGLLMKQSADNLGQLCWQFALAEHKTWHSFTKWAAEHCSVLITDFFFIED